MDSTHAEESLRPLLKEVSRSFYLSMVFLPPAMRVSISLAYLLARASDSVADSSQAPSSQRLRCLRLMGKVIAGDESGDEKTELLQELSASLAEQQEKASEAELLRRFEECLSALQHISAAQQVLIRKVLATIIEGQCWDMEYFQEQSQVQSDAITEKYTYMVAGCVGEFWTCLGLECSPYLASPYCNIQQSELMIEAAIRYGKGLQLVNILRDVDEDAQRGRSYLCSSREKWQQRARKYLLDGMDYSQRLGSFRLRFTAILPAMLGLKTLDALENTFPCTQGYTDCHDELIADRSATSAAPIRKIKISRMSVYACMVEACCKCLFQHRGLSL